MGLDVFFPDDALAFAASLAFAYDQATRGSKTVLKMNGVPDGDPAYAALDRSAETFKAGLVAMCVALHVPLAQLPPTLADVVPVIEDIGPQALIEDRTGKS